MRVRGAASAFLVAVLLAAGLGCQTGTLDYTDFGTATPTPSPSGTATPTPTPTPDFEYGNGQDGPLTVPNGSIVEPNTCFALASASGDTVTLASGTVAEGRALLVHQVEAAVGTVGDTSPLTDLGNAGRWEGVRVTAAAGTSLTVSPALANTYATAGPQAAQACIVPEYTTVTLTGNGLLRAKAFDGTSGGILALAANQLVTIGANATVGADGTGFLGGFASDNVGRANTTLDTTDTESGGGRGGSLNGDSRNGNGRGNVANGGGGGNADHAGGSGRGNVANGGGGGNADHAGGGGGGNGGAGGFGGKNNLLTGDEPNTRGKGGSAVVTSSRLVFGGGGGGGQRDNGSTSTGANGGGAIILFVASLEGSGTITADGRAGLTSVHDGTGGGGAGGSIFVSAGASTFTGLIRARGGKGGDQNNGGEQSGVGGGGGGGRLILSGVPGATRLVTGGQNGLNIGAADQAWGATPGDAGVIE